jgi:sugar phosphate isomerase/epimerase
LAKTIPRDKIYLLQISDAYKPVTPLSKHPDEAGMRSRARWSHDSRPLPFDGYLPVVDFAKAVLRTGFRGWFSYEVFDGGHAGNHHGQNMHDYVKIAVERQERLLAACVE